MNKIIKKDVVLEESNSELLSDLRRLNSKLAHDDISEESLAHFGVLGMKWGIRKDSSRSENRSARKQERIKKKEERKLNIAGLKAVGLANKKYLDIYNAMADESGDFYSKINNSEKYKKLDLVKKPDSKLAKEYYKECADTATASLQKHSDRILGNKIDSRLRVVFYQPEDFGSLPTFYVERADAVKHSDNFEKLELLVKFDKYGKLIKLDFPEDIFEIMNEDDTELAHFGVRGMKWGIRKDSTYSQNRSARKQEKIKKKEERELNRAGLKAVGLANKKYLDIYNAMADESAGFYRKINNSEKYKKLDLIKKPNSKLAKEYYKECADTATASLQKHSDRILGNKIDSRLKVVFYQPEDFGSMPSFYVDRVDIEHSDNSTKIKLLVKFDKYGKLIKLDFPEDIFEIMNEDDTELTHFGVRGMKWGIRKDSSRSENRSARKSRISMYKKRRIVSDDDLKKMVNRLETEKKLKSLVEEDITPGRVIVRTQLGKFGATALGAAAGTVGAILVKEALKTKGISGG